MSPLAIRKTILAELAGAPPEGLTQAGLLTLVQLRLRGLTMADLADELSWLRDHSLAAYAADPMDPDNREVRVWTVTMSGRASLKA
jgi:hypothetical protein